MRIKADMMRRKSSQKCPECAAVADWRLSSYLTLLCNTGSIPTYASTLHLFSPLSSCFLTFHSHSSIPAPSVFSSTHFLAFLSVHLSAALSPTCTRLPLSLSRVVVSGPPSSWLFLRLLKPMPVRDWWICVGLGHAGSVSMWRQENIWFIRPVG